MNSLTRRQSAFAVLAIVSACGGSPSSPTPVATVPGRVTIVASITNTVTGAAIRSVTTDVASVPALLDISEPGFVTRSAWITSARPVIDLIPDAPPFSLDFYRQLVRGRIDQAELQPLRRWSRAPQIYLTTVDEAGAPISAAQLSSTEDALRQAGSAYTGGRFAVAGVERGTGTRGGQSGWVTVKWLAENTENICGRATIGQDGGYIWLNPHRRGSCVCGSLAIRPRTVKHELGHAFGFWHTDSTADLMSGTAVSGCEGMLSERERYHAAIAYARPPGNRDVDVDPAATSSTLTTRGSAAAIVIDD